MEKVEKLLKDIISGIVDNKEAVEIFTSINKDERGDITILNIKVDKNDIGICIGRNGETAEAVRRVIGLFGFQTTGKRIYVKIDAPKIYKNHFETF